MNLVKVVNSLSPVLFLHTINKLGLRSAVQRLTTSQRFKVISFQRPRIYFTFLALSLFGAAKEVEQKTPKKMAQRKEILDNADQLSDESRYQECHELLAKIEDFENDPEVLWRKGRVLQRLSKIVDKKKKEEYIREGFSYVDKALKLDDNNFAIHKWYAILLDQKSELDGVKARVTELHNVKEHMIKATELNPNDATSWYILGEFEYGIADISWYMSKIMTALFSNPPTGTFERALECFLKAESVDPNFYSRNHLMLGKTYMQFKNMEKAKEHITIAANAKVSNFDEKITKEEAEQLLKKL